MNLKSLSILVVLAVILAGGGFWFLSRTDEVRTGTNRNTNATTTGDEIVTYVNVPNKISFTYPSDLYLKEVSRVGESPELSVVLVEDTKENRDVIEGRADTPREGPISITVEIYENDDDLEAREWMTQSTNWTIANSSATPATVGGEEGVMYTWSGLYEGKSIVISKNSKVYVFTVTWMTEEDELLKDFNEIINSVSFID